MILTKQNKEYYKEIIEHAESQPEEEVCGTVVLDTSLLVNINREKNESIDKKNMFQISPRKLIGQENIIGIYHSHPFGDENPSEVDKRNSEEMGVPFLIYSLVTKNFFLYIPRSYDPPNLLGRPYVRGFFECVNIPRDYYANINVPMAYEEFNYFPPLDGLAANKYMFKIFIKAGFLKYGPEESIKKHDMLIFQVPGESVFHVGVCNETDKFIHQKAHHLSGEDWLDDKWRKKIIRVYRHSSLV